MKKMLLILLLGLSTASMAMESDEDDDLAEYKNVISLYSDSLYNQTTSKDEKNNLVFQMIDNEMYRLGYSIFRDRLLFKDEIIAIYAEPDEQKYKNLSYFTFQYFDSEEVVDPYHYLRGIDIVLPDEKEDIWRIPSRETEGESTFRSFSWESLAYYMNWQNKDLEAYSDLGEPNDGLLRHIYDSISNYGVENVFSRVCIVSNPSGNIYLYSLFNTLEQEEKADNLINGLFK